MRISTVAASPAFLFAALILAGCASGPQVSRVDSRTQTDLSGRWNDSDYRIVNGNLIQAFLDSPSVSNWIQRFSRSRGGSLPVMVRGDFVNATSEHLDASLIGRQLETGIVNSGRLLAAAGGSVRDANRQERQDQMTWASEDTALSLANETAANLRLTGTINSSVDRAGGRETRSYIITVELTDIETNTRVWMAEDSSIKKEIRRSSVRF